MWSSVYIIVIIFKQHVFFNDPEIISFMLDRPNDRPKSNNTESLNAKAHV